MRAADDAVRDVERAVLAAGPRRPRLVLAVSGGLDSMVMLDAFAARLPERIAAVATFDHGTGEAATRAAATVVALARSRGLHAVVGRAGRPGRGEAEWRADRWCFLRAVAAEVDGRVATAHTADDQAETVFMRALRGAGARGLAGLSAESEVVRPLLALRRATVAAYAAARGIAHVDDPSNRSRRHLRNRVRLDLLPALEAARPGFHAWLLDLGRRAAEWRRAVDAVVPASAPERAGGLSVAAEELEGYDASMLAVVWPAIAARAGVTLDRRGTRRLAEFTISSAVGGAVQLSGGFEVVRRRGEFVLRCAAAASCDGDEPRALRGGTGFGSWRFREAGVGEAGLWSAELPAGATLTVRAWQPGDRMHVARGRPPRRVKRVFADAGISGMDRAGWPVVLADGEIVWIPGVRRADAAAVTFTSSGRPLRYVCERNID